MNENQSKSRKSCIDEVINSLIVDAIQDKEEVSVDELKRRRIIDGALSKAETETTRHGASTARRSRLRGASAIAASVAVVATTWIFVASGTNPSPGTPPSERPAADVARQRSEQAPRTTLEPSPVNMDFAPGIRAVATQDAQFTIDRTLMNRITVRITRGTVWVTKDPETKQTQLEIETPRGTVTVTGTVFSVHVDRRFLEVAVIRGAVLVAEEEGPAHTVSAGNIATVDDGGAEVVPLPRPEEAIAEFVRLGIIEKDDTPALSPVQTVPARTKLREGSRRSLPESGDQRVSAKTLLDRISLLRQQRDWTGMSTTYRLLLRDHRGSSQASLAMVSLGNLLIEKLDDPEGALHWFETYLQSDTGALEPEALFGKAKALRRLGDRHAELATLKEIVKRYPQSLYARQASKWIAGREQP